MTRRPTLLMRSCRFLLRLLGWKLVLRPPPGNKYVVVGAWHTSNWDFPLAVLATCGMGLGFSFVGKRELTEGRLGWLMRRLGVVGIDRSGGQDLTRRIAELFAARDELRLVVPAEGTRSTTEYWRTGFYYIALAAGVPIAFGVVDAGSRTIGIDGYFVPTGEREKDLAEVIAYFHGRRGLKPRNMGPVRFRPLEPEDEPGRRDNEHRDNEHGDT